jgi:hypothetical protein
MKNIIGDWIRRIMPSACEVADPLWAGCKTGFQEECELATSNDETFANFRRLQSIVDIIDTVGGSLGAECLDLAEQLNPTVVASYDRFRSSDACGNPELHQMGSRGGFSGVTARYIYFLTEIESLFGSLEGKSIIEIGGGYGGQCKIVHDLFKPAAYTLVDLPHVLKLAKRFLHSFGIDDVQYKTADELADGQHYDLVISNYAFTECRKEVQAQYLEQILTRSTWGYLKCNVLKKAASLPQYSKQELLSSVQGSEELPHLPEYPRTWTWCWGS